MAEKRARWHEQLAAERTAQLVFVDESGANTKMARLRGRALGTGAPPVGAISDQHVDLRHSRGRSLRSLGF